MADIFKDLDTFIADETVRAVTFSSEERVSGQTPRERRPRIVQVLHAHLFDSDCPPYLIISDGASCVHLFLPSLLFYNDESIPARDVQQHHDLTVFGSMRNKGSITRGALIKIQNYTILPISQCCKDYFSHLQHLPNSRSSNYKPFPIHPTVCWAVIGCREPQRNEKDTTIISLHFPLIQVLGCDGSNIFGNPLDVHENIDFRRAVRQLCYDTMVQRLFACHWYYSNALLAGSYLSWPYLLQHRRRIDIETNESGITEANRRPMAVSFSDRHTPGKDGLRNDHYSVTHNNKDSNNIAENHDANHDRRVIEMSLNQHPNTSEQEDLLSIYQSYELSEALLTCDIPIHEENNFNGINEGDPKSFQFMMEPKSMIDDEYHRTLSNHDFAHEADSTENIMHLEEIVRPVEHHTGDHLPHKSNNCDSDNITQDEETFIMTPPDHAIDQNNMVFACISEMLGENQSQDSSSIDEEAAIMEPCTQAFGAPYISQIEMPCTILPDNRRYGDNIPHTSEEQENMNQVEQNVPDLQRNSAGQDKSSSERLAEGIMEPKTQAIGSSYIHVDSSTVATHKDSDNKSRSGTVLNTRQGYKWLQHRAKLRKFNYYFIPTNDLK